MDQDSTGGTEHRYIDGDYNGVATFSSVNVKYKMVIDFESFI